MWALILGRGVSLCPRAWAGRCALLPAAGEFGGAVVEARIVGRILAGAASVIPTRALGWIMSTSRDGARRLFLEWTGR